MRETQKIHSDAKSNNKVALKAEAINCYEVATSRYYYELFLLILIYLKKENVKIPSKTEYIDSFTVDNDIKEAKKKGSHDIAIFTFLGKVKTLLLGENPIIDSDDLRILSKLSDLKDLRNTYEYEKNYRDKKEFTEEFKENYQEVLSVLQTITGYNN